MADPLGTGASALAFVGLALSSAKAIYDILAAVKDGPQNVRHLADEVKQLQDILARLSQLQVGTMDSTDLAELTAQARRCGEGLAHFNAKLGRLGLSQDDRRIGRIWKRLKAAVTEKDLDRMRDTIRDYTSLLNIRLSLLTTAQLSLSTTQSSEILELLKQLRADIHSSAISTDAAARVSGDLNDSEEMMPDATQPEQAVDAQLEESVDRLISVVKEKQCTVDSDEAEQLISDLQTLLESAQEKELLPTASEAEVDMHETAAASTAPNISRELKLVSNLILSAPSMSLNCTGTTDAIVAKPRGFVLQQERKRKVIDIGSGILTVTTNKRRRGYQEGAASSDGSSGSEKDFIAKLLFRANASQSLLSISLSQEQAPHGFFCSIPKMLLSSIRPRDSLVFKIAANGEVEDLMRLVAEGNASLHDHDPDGRSLLHFAASWNNHLMSQFLVRNGLDIDEATTECYTTPLLVALACEAPDSATVLLEAGADPTIDPGWGQSTFELAFGSSRDLTAQILEKMGTHSQHFGLSSYRDSRGRSPLLIILQTIYYRSCRALHSFWKCDHEHYVPRLSLLLSVGCSINDTDFRGWNCLHSMFARLPRPSRSDMRGCLMYLISQGADVWARECRGLSVSHFAYSTTCWSTKFHLGSYPGDLWDATLDACGYDIAGFRKRYPRRVRYTPNYTREDFERLWDGRQHRCPYWDDSDWTSPEDKLRGCSKASKQPFICVCQRNDDYCNYRGRPGAQLTTDDFGDDDYFNYRGRPASQLTTVDFECDDETDTWEEQTTSEGEGDDDLPDAQIHYSHGTGDCLDSLLAEDSSSEVDDPDQGTDGHTSSLYDAHIHTSQHEELFQCPWEDDTS